MSIGSGKTRKQITFNNDLLTFSEVQADKEERTLSGLIAIALKEYYKNHGIEFNELGLDKVQGEA